MSARQLRSANADRNRFIALYIGIVIGLLVAAGVFLYEARIVIDGHVRLAKWHQSGGGDSERHTLKFLPCSQDTAKLALARFGNDPRIPELKHLTSYPVFVPGFTSRSMPFNISRAGS